MTDMLNNFEISDECVDSLGRAYSNMNNIAVDDCPMSDLAIAYAAGELHPDENRNYRNHLQTCNYCLNLVIDLQIAENDSKAKLKRASNVLPGLTKAIKANKIIPGPDSIFKKLPPLVFKYLSPLWSPKLIAVAVSACLAFIIIKFGLNNPELWENLGPIDKEITHTEEPNRPPPDAKPAFTLNQDSQEQSADKKPKIYEPVGKIDPFEPLFINKSHVVAKKRMKRIPKTPLETFDLSQLKLVGIMLSESGNTALLEDATGKGYVIKNGVYIGTNGGKVTGMDKDKIIIEEEIEDELGKITVKKIELKLQKKQ